MLREGVPIGLLVLTRSEVQLFTDKQIELVTTYADQAAIAIESVRLFEAEQERTHELTKSLEDLRPPDKGFNRTNAERTCAKELPAGRRPVPHLVRPA
jgi:GAF domain-containing protein